MCLGFEGELLEVRGSGLTRTGTLKVADREIEIGLTFVPDAREGDRIIAHSGQAVRKVHEPVSRHET